jgi:hypothetical protein
VEPFSIVCPTCNARLKVRNEAAIGQILNCPKCASMVRVAAPAGWTPQSGPPETAEKNSPGADDSSRRRWENEVQPGEKVSGTIPPSASSGGWPTGSSSGDISSTAGSLLGDLVAPAPAPRDDRESRDDSESGRLQAAEVHATEGQWNLAGLFAMGWPKWTLLAGGQMIVIVIAVGLWSSRREPPAPEAVPELVDIAREAATIDEPKPKAELTEHVPQPQPVRLSRRWLPSDAQAVVTLRPRLLFSQPATGVVLDRTGAFWQPAIGKLAAALGIELQSLRRVTWGSTEVAKLGEADWLSGAVVTLELDRPATSELRALRESQPLDWSLDESPARALKSGAWPHPFAVIDKRTIVTGPEAKLRALAARKEHRLANGALELLVDWLDVRHAAVAAVDLRALHDAEALPNWLPLVEVLHADAEDWQLLRTMPLAVGLTLGIDEKAELELDLACDGESSAEQVRAALDRVLKAVETTIDGESDGLTDLLLAGQINAALAGELKHFLAGSQSALAARASGVRDSIVWARVGWQGDLPKLASGFLASVPQLEANRLAAARRLDEEHHHAVFAGIEGFIKAEGGFPVGAAGASLLPPDTRLSWQATLLPYYGHLDWHGELSFARSWNDPINARVTRRALDLMVNPALGPGTTKAGFPVTHYVGVAGLGADAGQVDSNDERAGVFGFRSRFAPAQIPDGASQTIALAGVSQKLGPWARGGDATVRGFTQRPYINGPDGFGSGQPDGMLVAMADGSVRFLPKDIDPTVLEKLVTIGGGDGHSEQVATASKPAGKDSMASPQKPVHNPKPSPKQPTIDIAARLAERVPSIELTTTTLSELVDLLSQLSMVPITLDRRGLATAGVDPDVRVALSLTDATIADILDEALRPYDLKYIEVGDQLIVTDARESHDKLESTEFNLGDLAASAAEAERLARLIETFVVPAAWQAAGGTGSIEVGDRTLALEQTPAVTEQVADFLDKLRLARELPVSRRDGRRLSLETRWARARDKLAKPVTATFAEPARLKDIAAHLQKSVGIEIVFDCLGLAAAGVSPTARSKFTASGEPLGHALDRLLEPLDLGYRSLSGQRIEITSARQVQEDLELEFYSSKSLLNGGGDADELAARIRKQVAPQSWREGGGSAVLTIDPVSSYLIVLAPQLVQIELERWLDALGKAQHE